MSNYTRHDTAVVVAPAGTADGELLATDPLALCREHGWDVTDDLTKHVTGMGTPTLKVSTPAGPALRSMHAVPVDARAAAAVMVAGTNERLARLMSYPKLRKQVPDLARTASSVSGPAFVGHGDLHPTNVVRSPDGSVRFIDVRGTVGPPEVDAGAWVAALVRMRYATSLTDGTRLTEVLSMASRTVDEVAVQAPHLDVSRLYAWTAMGVAVGVDAWLHGGGDVLDAWASMAIANHLHTVAYGTRLAPRAPGRNEPCPCGSGTKFKRCCGA